MARIEMELDVDTIAKLFSKTLKSLPMEGYGIQEKEAKWRA